MTVTVKTQTHLDHLTNSGSVVIYYDKKRPDQADFVSKIRMMPNIDDFREKLHIEVAFCDTPGVATPITTAYKDGQRIGEFRRDLPCYGTAAYFQAKLLTWYDANSSPRAKKH